MNRLTKLVAGAVIAATVAAVPPDSPEHARLLALCGTWDVEMTLWVRPGAPGIKLNATSTIRPILDSLFIEEKVETTGNGKPFTTLAWMGFNTTTREYEATRLSNNITGRIAESGVWNEQTASFELKAPYKMAGETWIQRTIIQPMSADSMVATSYLSFGNVPEWRAVEMRYKRKGR
jgi:hypothetical protein